MRHYTDYYYGSDGPKLEATPTPLLQQIVQKLKPRVGPIRGQRILDFGCGSGTLSRVLLEEGAVLEALETDPRARAAVSDELGIPVAGDLAELGGRTASAKFDLIFMIEVVEHLRDPEATLRDLHRLLKPSGFLYASTPDAESLRAKLDGARWSNYQNPTHLYYFNRQSLGRAMKTAGFADVRIWRPTVTYPAHGPVRRLIQQVLQRVGMDGALRMIGRATPMGGSAVHTN